MIITEHNKAEDTDAVIHNDDSDLHQDEIGENTGEDTGLAKAHKEDQEEKKDSSNKGNGTSKENL